MVSEKTFPLVVTDPSGNVLKLSWMNGKAYTKSLEGGKVWHVHDKTGRVLPLKVPGMMVSLRAGAEWYSVVVSSDTAPAGDPSEAAPAAGVSSGVLEDLAAVIAERRRLKPEGSYTTYLFESGPEKIRKKLGEEAVEVILAKNKEEITAESADLLYHLLVFLESSGISIGEVLSELAGRR